MNQLEALVFLLVEQQGKENLSVIVVSAIVGAVVSFVGALFNNLLGARTKVDESLRADRIKYYAPLWEKTALLPRWPRASDVTYARLHALSLELRDWYFAQGGMFLSETARKAYGDLQHVLTGVGDASRNELLAGADYTRVLERCSALRTELTRDLLSRRRAFFN